MKISNELKIGFWAIVALVMLFFGINYLKGVKTFKQGQFYYLSCDKVNGLAVSSHVTLHGLKIGMVRSMEYDQQIDRVLVALNIYDNDFMKSFICMYDYVALGMTSLITIMCYEGNYMDLLMSRKHPYQQP